MSKKINLKGGALFYVIYVVFVLTAITSLYLMHRGAGARLMQQEIRYFTCMDDINSALTLYLSAPEKYQDSRTNLLVLFDDTTRRVKITHKPYGLLDLVCAEMIYRDKMLSKTILAGKNPFFGDSIALYVPDNRQALYASGNTIIKGNVVIPAKGMQRASIEGKPLRAGNPVSGRITYSNTSLPDLASRVVNKLECIQNLDSLYLHSTPVTELYQSTVENSVDGNIQWFGSEDDYQISGFEARGGVGFCSTGTILIRKDALLSGTLVSARKIIVEDGFTGDVQLFAQDSLIIGKECRFQFPSVVCLNSSNVNNLQMEIGNNTSIEGTLLVRQDQIAVKKPMLIVKEGVCIKGQVYHQGKINLLGIIHGSLYCEGFYLATSRAHYENHLLDNEIDFLQLPRLFVTIDLMQGYHDQLIDIVDQEL